MSLYFANGKKKKEMSVRRANRFNEKLLAKIRNNTSISSASEEPFRESDDDVCLDLPESGYKQEKIMITIAVNSNNHFMVKIISILIKVTTSKNPKAKLCSYLDLL
jgi:hypothetical protein